MYTACRVFIGFVGLGRLQGFYRGYRLCRGLYYRVYRLRVDRLLWGIGCFASAPGALGTQ